MVAVFGNVNFHQTPHFLSKGLWAEEESEQKQSGDPTMTYRVDVGKTGRLVPQWYSD